MNTAPPDPPPPRPACAACGRPLYYPHDPPAPAPNASSEPVPLARAFDAVPVDPCETAYRIERYADDVRASVRERECLRDAAHLLRRLAMRPPDGP